VVIFSLEFSVIQMLYKMLRRFHISESDLISVFENVETTTHWIMLMIALICLYLFRVTWYSFAVELA